MSKLLDLANIGQSIWFDFIKRSLITSGELQNLIDIGLRGITSNPTIFDQAISKSSDYDLEIEECISKNLSVEEIYEHLALKDIALAADKMIKVYEQTNGLDGYVSIEVNPKFANNTKRTIEEAKRLFSFLNRKNIMIKIPATAEGIPAVTEAIASGINVNVTLIFSLDNYKQVAEAYIKGLEKLAEKENDLSNVSSVASFFVSRIDTSVDNELDKIANKSLQGKIAIANAKAATEIFNELFSNQRWKFLLSKGAKVQRLLWASTGTKNQNYSDVLYVEELIGAATVNTIPPATLNSFLKHGKVNSTLYQNIDETNRQLNELKNLNIDFDKITNKLQIDGVVAFEKSFESLLSSLSEKIKRIKEERDNFKLFLGQFENEFHKTFELLKTENVVERIWQKDFTVWNNEPTEIINRLGWLDSPSSSLNSILEINGFADSIKNEGFTTALLLGMGGSSLAPEVFSLSFKEKNINLFIIDTTDPETVLYFKNYFNPKKTLYIVSTKSGGTVETFSLMKFFYNSVLKELGKETVGKHFVAITDPGSGLETIAKELNFRKIFLNDTNIGGRYSALSLFGLVPAALLGINLSTLLKTANEMSAICLTSNSSAAKLGCAIGMFSSFGKDKLTLIISKEISSLGSWIEQLVAESTGKNGKGIVPIDGEDLIDKNFYENDRLFIYIHFKNDLSAVGKINDLKNSGHPVIEIILEDIYDLGREFFRWEFATAVAGWNLKIHPFDQPNVESAKIIARNMVKEFQQSGKLQELKPSLVSNNFSFFGNYNGNSPDELLKNFFNEIFNYNGLHRNYISIQAYLPYNDATTKVLQKFRTKIQMKFNSAVTVGFGPRFLHSTGQLHKGDSGNGLFIQLIAKNKFDANIPETPGDDNSFISFGILKQAQALGDRQALIDNGRKVLTIELKSDLIESIKLLTDEV